MDREKIEALVAALPKAELHLHIEGTLEPELMFELASRNGIALRHPDVESLRRAYDFQDLQSFLDLYYEGAAVLRTERDFHDLTTAYLRRMRAENVRHVEIFFDPQTHTDRGIPFETVIHGIRGALDEAWTRFGIDSRLILCFLRHLSPEAAMQTLETALPYQDLFEGVGLDSSERGRPPALFEEVFARARSQGLRAVAHAGEEGPAAYVREAIDRLAIERVDHGVRCEEDAALVEELAARRTPLTMCPLSNVKLRVFKTLPEHNLARLLRRGLCVTINSDDPAYFGGYLSANYIATAEALALSPQEIVQIAINGWEASFLPAEQKAAWIERVREAGRAFLD